MAGQSQASDDIAKAFLWNMIAIELLLTRQGDKYTDAIPQRIEAFLGWAGYWNQNNYKKHIQDVYKKRCGFVHAGLWEDITVKDLLFTDDLLLNLLSNIVQHQRLFNSKNALIDFSDHVAAEHVLGIKSRVRPKTLCFFSRKYNQKDIEEI